MVLKPILRKAPCDGDLLLYSSPRAGVTKHHRLVCVCVGGVLKTTEIYFLQFQMSKIKVTTGSCSLWGSREESVPLPYPSFWWLLAVPGIPWFVERPFPSVPVFTWHSVLDTSPRVRPISIHHDLILIMYARTLLPNKVSGRYEFGREQYNYSHIIRKGSWKKLIVHEVMLPSDTELKSRLTPHGLLPSLLDSDTPRGQWSTVHPRET